MTAQLDKHDSAIYNITDLPCIDITLQTLARRAMFWRPVYLAQSAWLEHIPFAFWMTEAHRPRVIVELGVHYGVSYFAFCQAVERLGLDTRCFGVDTFKGDEHAGSYDERVFARVREHNELQYSGFSRLVRSTFDEALTHFADGSVDLLHIDGLHTIDAVRHDFESWLPKLSNRAIVVMHDTNVRERNFGVFKLFEQLKQKYPHFEFVHGHGLGVLGVGKDQSELMQMLFQASNNEHGRQSVQEVFSRLGQACASAHTASMHQEKAKLLSESIEKQKKQLDDTSLSLEKAKADIDYLNKELFCANEAIRNQHQQHVTEREHFVERVNLFQELRIELKDEIGRLQERLEAVSAELKLKDLELEALTRERNHSQRQLDSAVMQVAERDRSLADLNEKLAACFAFEQKQKDAVNTLSSEKTELEERLAEQERDIANLRQTIDEERNEIIQANEQLRVRDAELEKTHVNFLQASTELEKLREENERQTTEISRLKQTLNTRDDALEAMSETLAAHTSEVADLKQSVESKAIEQQALQSRLAYLQSQNEELAQECQALIADKHKQTADLETSIKKIADLTRMLEEKDAILQEKAKEAKEQKKRLDDRFNEITALTKIIEERDLKLKAKEKDVTAQQQRANKLDSELQAKTEALKTHEKQLAEVKAQAAAAMASLQAEAKKLKSELQEKTEAVKTHEKQLAEVKKQAAAIQAQKDAALTQLQAEQKQLKSELQAQAKRLEERFKELVTLTKLLEERDRSLAEKDKELAVEKQRITQLTTPLMNPLSSLRTIEQAQPNTSKNAKKEVLSVKAQMLLIEKSGLFDSSWYLTQYPDVAESKMNPIQHYILHGASEGRMPGPHFDTKRYMQDYPEVLTSKLNPLVHYLKNGIHEGRAAVNA